MSQGDRLTRQELSWLLTQEARAAAQTLRKGVAALQKTPSESTIHITTSPAEMESSLDALDDAMQTLASLNVTMGPRGVRGRVDIAALVCEVAPSARVHLAPGSGTEVFGDESDLRRMIQVLVSQTGGMGAGTGDAPDVSIAREGDLVRVSVALGPETGSSASTERAWLSRMALRYGGRLELEGGQESLVLPAQGVQERNEVEALRKELAAAQEQGEAYARELAAVFAAGDNAEQASVSPSTVPPPVGTLVPLTALSSAVASQLRSVLAGLARDLENAGSRPVDPLSVGDALQLVQTRLKELQSDLSRLGKVMPGELPALLDVVVLVREQLEEADARAHRYGVHVESHLPVRLERLVPPTALRSLVRLLVDHAIAATPRDGRILVRLVEDRDVLVVAVEDAGASVPAGARDALLWRRIDPATLGRPHGVHLLSASAIISHLGGILEVEDAPGGGTRTVARIPPS